MRRSLHQCAHVSASGQIFYITEKNNNYTVFLFISSQRYYFRKFSVLNINIYFIRFLMFQILFRFTICNIELYVMYLLYVVY